MRKDLARVLSYIGTLYVADFPEVWLRKLNKQLQGWN